MFRTLLFATCCVLFASTPVQAAPYTDLSGWGWSDTIGWISFNCIDMGSCATSDYKMTRDTTSGTITGYAWSDSVGWISAQSADLTGCPQNPCSFRVQNSGKVDGWIKVLNPGSGSDGWINMTGDSPSPGGGTWGIEFTYGTLTGWAWGHTVVGWVFLSANLPCSSFRGNVCNGRDTWMFRDTETVIAE